MKVIDMLSKTKKRDQNDMLGLFSKLQCLMSGCRLVSFFDETDGESLSK